MNQPAPDNINNAPTDFLATPAPDSAPHLESMARASMTGGLGANLGTIPSLSVPLQDLTSDMRLHGAPRVDYNQAQVPSLGGIPLVAKISQGGMGAVYYGIHPRLLKEVAVKVLHSHLAEQNAEMVERFCAEARLAAQIQSQHLVGVLDVNRECGIYYFVMEFVRGCTAQNYLERAKQKGQPAVPESSALDICIAACTGLAAAHAEKIVHRDVKPGNILIPKHRDSDALRFRDAKLADLGLARNADLVQGLTGTGVFMGTPGFMAPEQVLDMKKCGAPADVFGLGATLFALLSGLPPFKGIVWTDPADPIHKSRPDISGWTAALIDRCLQKSPRKRYAGAEALLAALIECRESLDTAAPVDFTLQTVTAEPQRRISTHPTVLDSDFRAETLRYEIRQALFIAIPEAKEAKARQEWKLIVELLESLCADPVNADHPSKKIADGLLAQAHAELAAHSLKKDGEVKRGESTKSIAALPAEHARPISVRALKELVLELKGSTKLVLMLLPAGEYMMGSPATEQGRNKDELRHKVSISKPFYIGKFPVTQEQYEAVMGENPSQYRGGTLPVEGVAWDDGARFCAALSERTGKKLSLPTEAQWEYACRAGTATPFHFGTTLGTDLSNYDGHYAYGFGVQGLDRKKTTHAGTFKPNAFGLYDVHGNVWEWCRDFYHEHFYKNGPEIDPSGPATGKARVLRGGSWLNPPADCRSANRGRLAPNYRGANVGFRVAMESDD